MRRFSFALALMTTPVAAEVPRVVADIAPVHSIVSYIMDGVGEPTLIIPPGASPHGYAMRPSEAGAVSKADLIVWIGHGLTPWLEDPLETLGGDAHQLSLMDVPEMTLLAFREGDDFGEDHDHDHGHDHGEEDGFDPHVWLDPMNGIVAATAIAAKLAELDPVNAENYKENADRLKDQLETQVASIQNLLRPASGIPFITFHDAYHYFEARFDVEASATVSTGDAAKPGAARIAQVRAEVEKYGAVCAFAEPQMNTDVLDTVTEGQGARTGTLDPLGASLPLGSTLYEELLNELAQSMADCLVP